MEEATKQEGEFSLKGKSTKPKQLSQEAPAVTKVSIKEPALENKEEVTKVVIPNDTLKPEENAVQKQEAKEPVLLTEQPKVGLQEVGQGDEEPAKDAITKFTPLQEVTDEEIKQVTKQAQEAVRDEKVLGRKLPENVEKLVSFMEDTGGTVEDYVRLNADYSNIDESVLLKEYYKKVKPYLEPEDLDLILEDYEYDEDLEEERDIRKKKIAFKEEVAKAKNFLESTKSKYYDEIKLRPGVTQDQQKATDFFNRYNKQQEAAEQQHARFKESTKEHFNDNFEGFDIKVGEKSYKYNIQNRDKVAESQSNINNLVGKFLDSDGNVKDTKGYHKAMYAADNVDKIAAHFYEQGKADAVKEVVSSSKNLSSTKARSTQGEVFLNGFKVKAISGADSTKLRIKTKKFN